MDNDRARLLDLALEEQRAIEHHQNAAQAYLAARDKWIAAAYRAGADIPVIADQLGLARESVRLRLEALGVARRQRGPERGGAKK